MDNLIAFVKSNKFYISGLILILVIGFIFLLNQNVTVERPQGEIVFIANEPAYSPDSTSNVNETPPQAAKILVHIAGAVNNPGVYELDEGVRINDVLNAAGGAAENADLTKVNLAAFAIDAMQIIIPELGEDLDEVLIYPEDTGQTQPNSSGLININTATSAELQTLPGVGPVMAENIINYREANGGFKTVDELINVSRIGAATLERLRPLVRI